MSIPRLVDPASLPEALARPVVAIGNFDGVHAGHRDIIWHARDIAERSARPVVALTFSPHPRQYFAPNAAHFVLTSPDIQTELLAGIYVAGVVVLTFNSALASLGAEDFIRSILLERLAASAVVVGEGFRFGKARSGTTAMLEAAGKSSGFGVWIVPSRLDGEIGVSSTRIRAALAAGDLGEANRLLEYEWFVRGPVIHGEKRGRDLGYPTANMKLDPSCALKHGIYAVRVTIDGVVHPGVASFGRRPTFDNGAPLLETHVFDFKGDLYDRSVDVAFVRYLRGEEKFDSIDALVVQMDRDSAEARKVLALPKI